MMSPWPRCACGKRATVGEPAVICFNCMECQLLRNTAEPGTTIDIPPLDRAVGDGELDDLDSGDWEQIFEDRMGVDAVPPEPEPDNKVEPQ